MAKEELKPGKNIDCYGIGTGKKLTVVDFLDVQITDGVQVRVFLVKDATTGELGLVRDKQMLIAYDKHVGGTIGKYALTIFKPTMPFEETKAIVGDGNLMREIYEIVKKMNDWGITGKHLVISIELKTEVTI